MIYNAVDDLLSEIGVIGVCSYEGNTVDEIWDTLIINEGNVEKPDKDYFIRKVNEYILVRCLDKLRKKRNKLLEESDWTQMQDVNIIKKHEWKTYRQALRELPANTPDPTNISWPTPPS